MLCDSTGNVALRAGVSRTHPLAGKKLLTPEDFRGNRVMLVKKGDSRTVDAIRTELSAFPDITIEDTAQFYDMEVFNRCEQTQSVLITLECWKDVHPSLVTIPVKWDHKLPYGILYPLHCTNDVQNVIDAIAALS